ANNYHVSVLLSEPPTSSAAQNSFIELKRLSNNEERRCPIASVNVGWCMFEGTIVDLNLAEAEKCFTNSIRQSGNANYAPGNHGLGWYYYYLEECNDSAAAKLHLKALQFYERAIAERYAPSLRNAALIQISTGMQRLNEAANDGDPLAHSKIGQCYLSGF